jgi:3-methylcrotonyl-CoA carboxylase alpha subunit
MLRRLLVANRGEIACRVIRTARRMGVRTITVYSEADARALHTRLADEAWPLGASAPSQSYLSIDKLIGVAARSGAEAVHPGYGFLAESPEFARRCAEAGLIFVGPSAQAMRAVGDKAAAKALAARLGVATLPGYLGESQELRAFAAAAEAIGYPVVLKAVAGGGGRGMRVASDSGELPAAREAARREAFLAFGDDRLLLEKYLAAPRHVEVQVFADRFGEIVTFPERDCSLQRRHQKIVEETPAPHLTESLRSALCRDAATIMRAVEYLGAGTVEFLVDGEFRYFLEANVRLQVEHPVTEMICGVDLVEWQLRVASGEPLPMKQDMLRSQGCAIEARLCAEDPAEGFRPSTGVLEHLRFPDGDVRIETGVACGDAISPHYDSLLAKLVVWSESRDGAVGRLQCALDQVEVAGVVTNLDFLRAIARDARFIGGHFDTRVLDTVARMRKEIEGDDLVFALGAAIAAWRRDQRGTDEKSPWAADGWRLLGPAAATLSFRLGEDTHVAGCVVIDEESFWLERLDRRHLVVAVWEPDHLILFVDGVARRLRVITNGRRYDVIEAGRTTRLDRLDPLAPPAKAHVEDAIFVAPLPARVARVFVRNGDPVEKGTPVLLLEAMKMEIPVNAAADGTIERILCREGQSVSEGAKLFSMAAR